MPQMFPMNWLILFITIIIVYSLLVNKMFFQPSSLMQSKSASTILHLKQNINTWVW